MSQPAPQTPPANPPPLPSETAAAPPLPSAARASGPCVRCGYDLRGLPATAMCPECATRAVGSTPGTGRATCISCSYDLHGLPDQGRCPECGTGVEFSRYTVLLRSRGGHHLARLHWGVVIILTAIPLQLGLLVVMYTLSAFEGAAASMMPLVAAIPVLMYLLLFAILAGWWLLTTPDPRNVERETCSGAPGVVRTAAVIQAAALLTLMVLTIAPFVLPSGNFVHDVGPFILITVVFVAIPLVVVAMAVQFFASMIYIKWLAARLPSEAIARRAGLVIWLVPLIAVAGSVIVIGPLIALAFYWNLLDMVRKHLKQIRAGLPDAEGAAA